MRLTQEVPAGEGRYNATRKRQFKYPWCKTGPLKSSLKWIRTSKLPMKIPLSAGEGGMRLTAPFSYGKGGGRAQGLSFGLGASDVSSVGFRVWGFRFGVWNLMLGIWGLGFGVSKIRVLVSGVQCELDEWLDRLVVLEALCECTKFCLCLSPLLARPSARSSC